MEVCLKRTIRQCLVSIRTMKHIKAALHEDAMRQNRTESDLVHLILSRHYGFDPVTGDASGKRRNQGGTAPVQSQEVNHG